MATAAVAFGDMSNETPLMFSRSSSLGSLSSLEQQVALEDPGSAVGDFRFVHFLIHLLADFVSLVANSTGEGEG